MSWLFTDSRQILKFKDPRCYSRYSGAGREALSIMNTESSIFTDTAHDPPAHFCSNPSTRSITGTLSSLRYFLSVPQAHKHKQLISAWQPQSPALFPLDSPRPAWSCTCWLSLLPSSSFWAPSPPAVFLLSLGHLSVTWEIFTELIHAANFQRHTILSILVKSEKWKTYPSKTRAIPLPEILSFSPAWWW